MTVRERIIELINDENYKPLNREEFAAIFGLDRKAQKPFFKVLDSLEKEGVILKNSEDKYTKANTEYLVVGDLQGSEKGFGFVLPKDKSREDVFVSIDNLNGAVHGDTVLVNIISKAEPGKRQEGEILRIIERRSNKIVGTFVDNKSFGFVLADEKKFNYDIFIPKKFFSGAKDNQKVVVEIIQWPEKGKNPEGKVVEVLGYMSEKGTDIVSIIRQYELPEKFPKEVLNYVDNNINQEVTEDDIKNRLDLRDVNILTMDGFDAKDLDDAISIEKMENGNYKLGVHIADVSHYVKENTVLDNEAFERANSVYLLDRVIPMLPEELSNGICSLHPGLDRLTMSVFMEIDKSGTVRDSQIRQSVINSKARLVYDDVSDYLEDQSEEVYEKLKNLGVLEELKLMEELQDILMKKRNRRGSLDFDFIESRIILDEKGRAVEIVEEERRIGNRIIEEFMIVCNETVAEQYYWLDIPFLYRIHEEPSEEKMEDFIKVIHNFGYRIKGDKEVHPRALQELLEEVKGKREESLISMLMLRSLRKAVYSEESDIHFGLASNYYSHFTAPIRRYSDLIVHRIIKDYINGNLSKSKIKRYEKNLPDIADYISKAERRAEEAEREVDDMKKAEYMVQFIGEEFTGVISSLTRFGIFVQLENTVEGLIRYADMRDDYYDFDEENYIVIGERTGRIYRLGEEVGVIVANASPASRSVDFIFVD